MENWCCPILLFVVLGEVGAICGGVWNTLAEFGKISVEVCEDSKCSIGRITLEGECDYRCTVSAMTCFM